MKLTIRKADAADSTRCRFDDARSVYAWTTYELEVIADDFRDDATSACTLALYKGASELAACALASDGVRRDRRMGTLVVGDAAHRAALAALCGDANANGSARLEVRLGTSNAVVLGCDVPFVYGPERAMAQASGSGAAQAVLPVSSGTASLWESVDLGSFTQFGTHLANGPASARAFAVELKDRTLTKVQLDIRALVNPFDLLIVPVDRSGAVVTSGLFEAYLEVKTVDDASAVRAKCWASRGQAGSDVRRLKNIVVGTRAATSQSGQFDPGASVAWGRQDGFDVPSASNSFVVRLERRPFSDAWRADFEVAGQSVGVERDPDGAVVPGVNVNAEVL